MSDLQKLAQRLITIDQLEEKSVLPSAIFGAGINIPGRLIRRTPFRIGMWPCVSSDNSEQVMGVWTALSYLLEQQAGAQVYRMFARLDGDPEAYEWEPTKSQFDPDDWGIDELDDNIAIWGTIVTGTWNLSVYVENDAHDDNDDETSSTINLVFDAENIQELLQKLPVIAAEIHAIYSTTSTIEAPYETVVHENNTQLLDDLLNTIFPWERNLLLMLWGKEWDDDAFLTTFETLTDLAAKINTDFAVWLACSGIARAMLPGYSMVGELLVTHVNDVVAKLNDHRAPAIIFSRALYRLGYTEEAYEILQNDLKAHPQESDTRRFLADIYAGSGRIQQAIQVIHTALKNDWMTAKLYRLYGDVLLTVEQRQLEVEDFYLIDPDDYPDEELPVEAIAAYEEVLKLDESDVATRYQQLLQLMYVDEDRFWDGFELLLEYDASNLYIQDVVDAMHMMADLTPAIDLLEEALEEAENPEYRMMLASLYLLEDDPENAREHLETLQASDDRKTQLIVEYMMLSVLHDGFEERISDITSSLNASRAISNESVDFLERVTQDAPNYAGGYILLTRAYRLWDDDEAALEVMLDAQSKMPEDVDILEMLGTILWESGEQQLAFQYLNQGLGINPDYVPILVRVGRYLFDNGQREDARTFLSRAEVIDPRNPALSQTRAYIARSLAE